MSLLQGNIAQNEKFESSSGVPQALSWYADRLGSAGGDLVVAPETAIPILPQQLPEEYWSALIKRFSTGQQAALIGMPTGSHDQGYANSVLGFVPGGQPVWRYDKHHLVPFGEFTPPWFKWFTAMMHIPLGDFNRGALGQASLEWRGQHIAPNICYEDLFSEELAVRFADPASAPTILVNVSNLAWFADSIAMDQHLAISRMRALEFERGYLRATNTGATAIVDHHGQVVAQLPRQMAGVLEGRIEGRHGITPYAWWVSHWGLWPLWLIILCVLGWAWRRAP